MKINQLKPIYCVTFVLAVISKSKKHITSDSVHF